MAADYQPCEKEHTESTNMIASASSSFAESSVRSLELAVKSWDEITIGLAVASAALLFASVIAGLFFRKYSQRLDQFKTAKLRHDKIVSDRAIADSNRIGAEAVLETEKIRLVIAKMQAPRTLSAGQRAQFISKLKTIGRERVEIFALLNEGEVSGLCGQIVAAMREAGWDARSNANRRVPQIIVDGLLVETYGGTSERTRNASVALVAALNEAGLKTSGPIPSQSIISDARIELLVGHKP